MNIINLLKNIKIVYKYIDQVKKGRDYFKKKIIKLGFNVIGGQSNFLLVNFKNEKITEKIYWSLFKKYIYVKGNYKPPLNKCILFTCGPEKIMQKVYNEIYKIIK